MGSNIMAAFVGSATAALFPSFNLDDQLGPSTLQVTVSNEIPWN